AAPQGTLRLGPLSARPRITLIPIGIDTNVFNDTVAPKSDVIVALLPSAQLSTHLGRGTLAGTSTLSMTRYRAYASQSSNNWAEDVRFEYPLNHLDVQGAFAIASLRERPSLEIDLRVRRKIVTSAVAADTRLSPKTVIRLEATHTGTTYERAVVNGVNLPTALDGTNAAANVSLRHAFSALTTGVFAAEWLR